MKSPPETGNVKTTRRKRTTEITIDADEVVIAHRRPSSVLWWCPDCGKQTPMLPLDDATRMSGVDLHTMNGWVKARRVHRGETGPTGQLICWASLARQL